MKKQGTDLSISAYNDMSTQSSKNPLLTVIKIFRFLPIITEKLQEKIFYMTPENKINSKQPRNDNVMKTID